MVETIKIKPIKLRHFDIFALGLFSCYGVKGGRQTGCPIFRNYLTKFGPGNIFYFDSVRVGMGIVSIDVVSIGKVDDFFGTHALGIWMARKSVLQPGR